MIHTEVEQPRDVIAKVVNKGTETLSRINKIFESDCVDIQEKVNKDEISVNEAYKQVKKAQKAKETQQARTELAAKAKEVEPSKRWRMFQTDMTAWQNEIQYDFIITDPPYLKEYLHLYEQIAVKAREWLKPDSLLIVMCGQSYLDKIYEMMSKHLTYYWTAAYLTPGQPTPLRQRQVNTVWKPLLIFTNGEYKGKIFSDVFTSDKNEKDFHKWGQSMSGMLSIISQVCLPGQFILDPFCGAGTTGVAALKHGCLFHGIEIDIENTKISKARLSEYDNK
jgi:site-specific DNA-methyltransferase (adenine-specific)